MTKTKLADREDGPLRHKRRDIVTASVDALIERLGTCTH